VAKPSDETGVDLEFIEIKPAQTMERRKAGAKIIERYTHAKIAKAGN
jgi:hypothetical protein